MTRLHRRIALVLPVAVSVLLQVGCVPRQIREAQDTFNQAAQSENAQRATLLSGGAPPLDASSAVASYRIALDLLKTELDSHAQDLAQEQLLGTAMMLKALSLWRLADLEDGPAAAAADAELTRTLAALDTLVQQQPTALGTRDRVMVKAIPGLRDHDRGLRATTLPDASANFESACGVLEQALTTEKPPPNHPVRTYIRLAQLASLRSYQSAVFQFDPNVSDQRATRLRGIHTCAEKVVLELKPVLKDDTTLTNFVNAINTAIGIGAVGSIAPGARTCPYIS